MAFGLVIGIPALFKFFDDAFGLFIFGEDELVIVNGLFVVFQGLVGLGPTVVGLEEALVH